MSTLIQDMKSKIQPLTTLLGNNKFSWNGNTYELPQNIANGSESIQQGFITLLRLFQNDIYYMRNIPKNKVREFALKKAAEKIKDLPPDPIFLKIYAVAQAAVVVFLVAITGSHIAKL